MGQQQWQAGEEGNGRGKEVLLSMEGSMESYLSQGIKKSLAAAPMTVPLHPSGHFYERKMQNYLCAF